MSHALLSLVIAGVAFFGSHTLLSSTRLRGSLRDQIGEQGFLLIYSLTGLVTFAWFVLAYARAPYVAGVDAAALGRLFPDRADAAGDVAAGLGVLDAEPDRGRHGTLGPRRRPRPRHHAGDPPSRHVGARAVGAQPFGGERRSWLRSGFLA